MTRLKLSQRVSSIGRPESQRKVLRGLGLRKLGGTVIVDSTPSFRGMVKKVMHLIDIEEVKS